MTHKFLLGLGIAAILSSPAIASAQAPRLQLTEISRLMGQTPTVALNAPTKISGRVAQIVGNQFGVSDLTGQVVVKAGPDNPKAQLGLKVGDQVTVTGELLPNRRLKATSITRADGTPISLPPSNSDRAEQPK